MATPLLSRLPLHDDPRRHEREHDLIAKIINDLIGSSQLGLGAGGTWTVNPSSSSSTPSVGMPVPADESGVRRSFFYPPFAPDQDVANWRPDGSVVFIDPQGRLSVSIGVLGNSTFAFDETGVGGVPTLYVGFETGVLALANGGSFTTFVPSGDGSGLTINADITMQSFIATGGQFTQGVDLYDSDPFGDIVHLTVRESLAQTVDLQRWTNNSGTVYSSVNKVGYLMTRKTAAPADGDVATSEVAWWLTNTAGAPAVNFKGKDATPTVFNIALYPNGLRVHTAAGAATLAKTDCILVINKGTGAATTVNLPAAPVAGQVFVIKDGKGDAAANNITLTPAAGNIDGAGTFVMATNYQSATIAYNGTEWNLI